MKVYTKLVIKEIKMMSIPIVQVNKETGELKEWESTKKCANELNCSIVRLCLAVNGKNRKLGHEFKGYLWYKKQKMEKY